MLATLATLEGLAMPPKRTALPHEVGLRNVGARFPVNGMLFRDRNKYK